jgi:hypothetical protein
VLVTAAVVNSGGAVAAAHVVIQTCTSTSVSTGAAGSAAAFMAALPPVRRLGRGWSCSVHIAAAHQCQISEVLRGSTVRPDREKSGARANKTRSQRPVISSLLLSLTYCTKISNIFTALVWIFSSDMGYGKQKLRGRSTANISAHLEAGYGSLCARQAHGCHA